MLYNINISEMKIIVTTKFVFFLTIYILTDYEIADIIVLRVRGNT